MAELGAISEYALAVQQMQMSLIKNQAEMQQQAVEILVGGTDDRSVSPSATTGINVDKTI